MNMDRINTAIGLGLMDVALLGLALSTRHGLQLVALIFGSLAAVYAMAAYANYQNYLRCSLNERIAL